MNQQKNKGWLSWLLVRMRKRLPMILCMTVLNILTACMGVASPLVTQDIIDSAIATDAAKLKWAVIAMIAINVLRIVIRILSQYLDTTIRAGLDRDFKRYFLHKILHCEYADIAGYHSGDLIQRMSGDASTAYSGMLILLTSICSYVTSLVAVIFVLMRKAPEFTVLFLLGAAAVSSVYLLFKGIMKRLHKEQSAFTGKVSGFLHESISRLMVIQALDVSDEMERRANEVLRKRWQVQKKQRNVTMLSGTGSMTLATAGQLVTLLWCVWKLYCGEITYGMLMSTTSLVAQLQTSMTMFPHLIPRIFAISTACERMLEIENLPDQPAPEERDAGELYDRMTGITASHLTFSYDRDPVMRDVSLTIPKGGLTVIVGPSGIGKSTLFKLLLGLYRPDSGSLSIDTPEGPLPISRAARSLFTYAPQGNFLLSGTLRENLLLTNPGATDEQIRYALYVSAMEEYVASLPDGLDTMLSENGAGLSEGQGQRLNLARAIISGAPVLLLDEVTSALDAVTEQTVLERITALPGRTCIAVTHRPAALELADHVIEVTQEGMTLRPNPHRG